MTRFAFVSTPQRASLTGFVRAVETIWLIGRPALTFASTDFNAGGADLFESVLASGASTVVTGSASPKSVGVASDRDKDSPFQGG